MKSRSVRRIAAPCLGAALAVAVMELVVRDVYTLRTTWDPGIGVIYDPSVPVRWRREGDGTSHWDARGVRRNAHDVAGREGSVLVVGDSYTEGLMVDDGETYPSLAQDALQAARADLAVLNAGRSTNSAADYVAQARRNRQVFDPRWTVVQLREEDFAEDAWDDKGARFTLDSAGRLSVVPAVLEGSRVLGVVERHSMLLAYGFVRAAEMNAAGRARPPLFRASEGPPPAEEDDRDYPLREALRAIADAHDGRVTLLWLPDVAETIPEKTFDLYCRRTGLSCVNARDALERLRREGRAAYGFPNTRPDHGHLNRHGHRAVAGALAEELLRLRADGLL